jgi:hypothetical protein
MMILSQYHIFELDTINIYSADMGLENDALWSVEAYCCSLRITDEGQGGGGKVLNFLYGGSGTKVFISCKRMYTAEHWRFAKKIR